MTSTYKTYRIILIYLFFFVFFIQIIANPVNELTGRIFFIRSGNKTGIGGAKILFPNSNYGCYSNKEGYFYLNNVNIPQRGEIIIIKESYIATKKLYKINRENQFELIPKELYYYLPPFIGPLIDYDTVTIKGKILSREGIPIQSAYIHLLETPHFTVSQSDGSFVFKIPYNEIDGLNVKKIYIAIDKKGIDTEVVPVEKSNLLRKEYVIPEIKVDKYISTSEITNLNTRLESTETIVNLVQQKYDSVVRSLPQIREKLAEYDSLSQKVTVISNNLSSNIELISSNISSFNLKFENLIDNLENLDTLMIALKSIYILLDSIENRINTQIKKKISELNAPIDFLKNESYNLLSKQDTTLNTLDSIKGTVDQIYKEGFQPLYPNDTGIHIMLTYGILNHRFPDEYQLPIMLGFNHWISKKFDLYINYNFWLFLSKKTDLGGSIAINMRPFLKLTPYLYIDPGFGFYIGRQTYSEIDTIKLNEITKIPLIQPYIQLALSYSPFIEKNNVSKNIYLFFNISNRIIIENAKFKTGLASFNIGIKMNIPTSIKAKNF